MSKRIAYRPVLRIPAAAKAKRAKRDTAVRTFRPGLDGVPRCVTCRCTLGVKHAADCRPAE